MSGKFHRHVYSLYVAELLMMKMCPETLFKYRVMPQINYSYIYHSFSIKKQSF